MQLSLDHLACRRAGRLVFTGLTVSLGAGEALLVTGRNGAGKSTLLAAIAGLLRPAEGRITLAGTGERSRPECVHHLGHRDGLKPSLTAAENLAFAAAVLGSAGIAPGQALAKLGIGAAAGLPVGYLSAGQRRRVMLGRLLVARRPVWLLDEPTTALDREGRAVLFDLLDAHLAEGGLLVAATHAPLPIPGARELSLSPPPPAPPSPDDLP
ncbi:heme ABC exporter ATP-binding protein CcmA [Enterovirga sp.]|uniref:heme ABC exporter ATP-binding protein CcmA n=1 Tax=Enterovirga sp. TaxID=2026350 RepID=UPI002603AECD|nr:heme ABC exporter ATP-binding protein CcmA [Enterovirga sp.]MDB5590052.1 ccmA [Enterovirga sp.]